MSVKLAKNGTWLAQFRCKDKFGNEVHKCKRGFATAEEAQAWEDEFIASAGCTMEMTFGEFFKVYEADLRPRLREHTWRQKEYAIKSRVLPFFANKKMDEIRTIDIVRWQNALMAPDANDGKPYSATYLRTLNNQLTAILNHAERYYGLSPNPAMRTVKMGGKEARTMSFWTKDEYLRFSDATMNDPRAFVIFEVLYWTGIREGELLALTPDSFDWKKSTMRIDKSYQRLGGRDVITDPKTPKSVRTVKLSRFLADEVRDYAESESAPFPLTHRFPSHMMRATEDRRRIWEPHRQGTRPSSSRRRSSCAGNQGPPTPRWRAGSDATRAAFRIGRRRPTRPNARPAATPSRRPSN